MAQSIFDARYLQVLMMHLHLRVMTGISIGGALPIVYSVLGDLYPANQRNAIAALVSTGTGESV